MKKEKEHQLILKLLTESDERIKKLLELEEIKQLEIIFRKHPKSKKFNDNKWKWSAGVFNRRISIPLDKNNFIIPYDKNERLFNLAHEFSHILLGEFFLENCACDIRKCLSKELQTHIVGARFLQKINVRFKKDFWRIRLVYKWQSCKECLKVINKGKCPETEREKIKECLLAISTYKK